MGSTHLFTLQQALKVGVFYWLRIQSSNHLHSELSLGYLKDTKFCRESKAFFIYKSSIASLKGELRGKNDCISGVGPFHSDSIFDIMFCWRRISSSKNYQNARPKCK